MKDQIIENLRKLSYVPGKVRTWVLSLSSEELRKLFLRLRNGESTRSIARHAQEFWLNTIKPK